jgi:uncharacterized protein
MRIPPGGDPLRYVLFYESGDEVVAKVPVYFPAHRARWLTFRDRGELLMVGPFADGGGAMAIFTSAAAAHEFAEGDPFVTNGVVRDWHVREWREAIGDPAQPVAD